MNFMKGYCLIYLYIIIRNKIIIKTWKRTRKIGLLYELFSQLNKFYLKESLTII